MQYRQFKILPVAIRSRGLKYQNLVYRSTGFISAKGKRVCETFVNAFAHLLVMLFDSTLLYFMTRIRVCETQLLSSGLSSSLRSESSTTVVEIDCDTLGTIMWRVVFGG